MWKGAIVGSGPACFYTIKKLLERSASVSITVIEKNRFPFGLIRSGVAPDHPELKQLQSTFREILYDDRVQILTNFQEGDSLDYQSHFHFVVDARGSCTPNRLACIDYSAPNVLDSDAFVGWVNGNYSLPESTIEQLFNSSKYLVLGQGNVALDVARFLISDESHFRHGDVGYLPLKWLLQKSQRCVSILGRRPPDKTSFTTKEMREILNRNLGKLTACPSDILSRPYENCKIVKLMHERLSASPGMEVRKGLQFTFQHEPIGCLNGPNGRVVSVQCRDASGYIKSVDSDFVITCTGYKSDMKDIPNDLPLFKAGWRASGPHGTLADSMASATRATDKVLRLMSSQSPGKKKELVAKDFANVYDKTMLFRAIEFETVLGNLMQKSLEKRLDKLV